jgi:hypothetical protein
LDDHLNKNGDGNGNNDDENDYKDDYDGNVYVNNGSGDNNNGIVDVNAE